MWYLLIGFVLLLSNIAETFSVKVSQQELQLGLPFHPSLLSSVVVVVIVVVVIVVIVIIVVVVVIDIDHVDAYPCSNTGGFNHDVNHQPEKKTMMTVMVNRKGTNVKAKSIMTLMLVAARAKRAKTPAASFAHLCKKLFSHLQLFFFSPFFTSTIFFL